MRVIMLAFACVLSLSAAQSPSTPPKLSEVDSLRIQLVRLTDQLSICQQTLNKNHISNLSEQVRTNLEATYPGWTVNWETGQLVAKQQAPSNNKEK